MDQLFRTHVALVSTRVQFPVPTWLISSCSSSSRGSRNAGGTHPHRGKTLRHKLINIKKNTVWLTLSCLICPKCIATVT